MEWIERIVRFVVSQMICIPFFKRPFQDLSHPQAYGMKNTENLRLAVNDNQEIGAWFMLPTTPAGKSMTIKRKFHILRIVISKK